MTSLDTLATYYVQLARREKNKETRKDYFAQVRKYDVPYKINSVYVEIFARNSYYHDTYHEYHGFVS